MKTAKELEDLFGVSAGQIEEWDKMASEGILPGKPAGEVVKGPGRPQKFGEELVAVTFKMPRSQLAAVDERAESLNETRSEYLRKAMERDLAMTA